MKDLLSFLQTTTDPGNIGYIEAHWAFHIGGAICLILLALCGWLTYKAFVNKNNYYDLESDKLYWLKHFWHKNRILFYVIIDIILVACAIAFFMAGAGYFQ